MKAGAIKTFLIGTHVGRSGLTLHAEIASLAPGPGYTIEVDHPIPANNRRHSGATKDVRL